MMRLWIFLTSVVLLCLEPIEAANVGANDKPVRRNGVKGLRVLSKPAQMSMETFETKEDKDRALKDKKDLDEGGRTHKIGKGKDKTDMEAVGNHDDNNGGPPKGNGAEITVPEVGTPKIGEKMPSGKKSAKGSGGKERCTSYTAKLIRDSIPEAITENPTRCCESVDTQTVVFVTHAESRSATSPGFEEFWDMMYEQIDATTEYANVCFVMTGYNQFYNSTKSLSEVLIETNAFVSAIPDIAAMMSTDPTNSTELIQTIRTISETPLAPPIGVFNAGWGNIVIEALVSDKERLQFVGNIDDSMYGTEAAKAAVQLLGSQEPVPLCLNGRPDIVLIGERCARFYSEVSGNASETEAGVACNSTTNPDYLLGLIMEEGVNVIFSHVDCCKSAADAVRAATMMGLNVILGCQDIDTSGGYADFVTSQPIDLQAYHTATWTILPALQRQEGFNLSKTDAFPYQRSLINTAVFNEIIGRR